MFWRALPDVGEDGRGGVDACGLADADGASWGVAGARNFPCNGRILGMPANVIVPLSSTSLGCVLKVSAT